MPTLAQWQEWHARCALGRCAPETQSALAGFAGRRTRRYLALYGKGGAEASRSIGGPDDREAWHGFETYFYLNRTRAGKSYKDWLAARGTEASPAAIESGAALLLRDVVRERLRREAAPRHARSLQEPLPGADADPDCALTLEDLLPSPSDPAGDADRRDLEHLAVRVADAVFHDLSLRERMALLAREHGLSCAHPAALRAAGCGKTVLAKAFHSALRRTADGARRTCPGEPPCVLAALSVAAFAAVNERIRDWDRAENHLSQFLYL